MRWLLTAGLVAVLGGLPLRADAAPESAAGTGRAAPRRLEDIHIEGEIPVPQVLFVTGRDQRRFLEFHPERYLKSSVEIGRETLLPSHFLLVGMRPSTVRKEIAP